MRKYIVVFEDVDTGLFKQWEDADIRPEFVSYEDALDYIVNIQPVDVPLDIMSIDY